MSKNKRETAEKITNPSAKKFLEFLKKENVTGKNIQQPKKAELEKAFSLLEASTLTIPIDSNAYSNEKTRHQALVEGVSTILKKNAVLQSPEVPELFVSYLEKYDPSLIERLAQPANLGDGVQLVPGPEFFTPGHVHFTPGPAITTSPEVIPKPSDFPKETNPVKPPPANPPKQDGNNEKSYMVRQTISDSLIPVKGISKKIFEQLRKNDIFDVLSLLSRCNTSEKRKNLAKKLNINVRHIEMWVKQVDLWRVDGMTTDLAYFIAQAGVRSYLELAHVDAEKIWPIVQNLYNAQPDYIEPRKTDIEKVINAAIELYPPITVKNADLNKFVKENSEAPKDFFDRFKGDVNPYQIEPTPQHLYRDIGETEESSSWNKFTPCWIDFDFTLPLPKKVSGYIYKNAKKDPFEGVKVELEGIVCPNRDKSSGNPFCVTGVDGRFIIVLPTRATFCETVKIIVSTKYGSQTFVKNSTEIIDSLKEHRFVDGLQKIMDARITCRIINKDSDNFDQAVRDDFAGKIKRIEDEFEDCKDISDLLGDLQKFDDEKEFDEFILRKFNDYLDRSSLEAKIEGVDTSSGDDGFIVDEQKLVENKPHGSSTLPSVKLMGEDENPLMLSTDCASSKVYSYSMLQRLIEPELSSNGGRGRLTEPIDVATFKKNFYENPQSCKKMSSLGLGYQLNMHQAWIPDGFALGDLLYSLVLAPGEEQRLVVRENKEAYSISDSAEGVDNVSEGYSASQVDDATAAYNYAINQMMTANSSFNTHGSSFGAGFGTGAGGSGTFSVFSLSAGLGLSKGFSVSSSSGSSNASQNNSQDEASSAAQHIQHSIKSASNRLAQAKRISISSASSYYSNSVATKIVANHNHSHAMTMQYWEVMRQYRLETAIDSVDLVLFVPMQPIQFFGERKNKNNESGLFLSNEEEKDFDKEVFRNRYGNLLKYIDVIEPALPYSYRTGLGLIRKFAAHPNWIYEAKEPNAHVIKFSFKGNFLSCDRITARIYLKNGKGFFEGRVEYESEKIGYDAFISEESLKSWLREQRSKLDVKSAKCEFALPSNVSVEDISCISLKYSCEDIVFSPVKHISKLFNISFESSSSYFKQYDQVVLSNVIQSCGALIISDISIEYNGNSSDIHTSCSETKLTSESRFPILFDVTTLKRSDLQKMEETFRHVVTETLYYSQVVWNSLTSDELALLLDQYNVDMDYSKIADYNSSKKKASVPEPNVPLLNCINVRKPLGFYGNCMLFPFTFPQELAEKLGRTAADIQEQIYRYHTNAFRAPMTVVSLPTKGMVGEAVLGQTNVSEVIDLTRFWNWQDSPIDKMEINKDYLDSNDYLNAKNTKDVSELKVASASAPNAVAVSDLINALAGKTQPTFTDITGLAQLSNLVEKSSTNALNGYNSVINASADLAKNAMSSATQISSKRIDQASAMQQAYAQKEEKKAEREHELTKIDKDLEKQKLITDTQIQIEKMKYEKTK